MVADDAGSSAAPAGRFYREEFAGRPVLLCVDEEPLPELAHDKSLSADQFRAPTRAHGNTVPAFAAN